MLFKSWLQSFGRKQRRTRTVRNVFDAKARIAEHAAVARIREGTHFERPGHADVIREGHVAERRTAFVIAVSACLILVEAEASARMNQLLNIVLISPHGSTELKCLSAANICYGVAQF